MTTDIREEPHAATAVGELKNQLLAGLIETESDKNVRLGLKRAAQEAASLAWTFPYPLLVLPELMNEKLAEAHQRALRQQDVGRRSQDFLTLAE